MTEIFVTDIFAVVSRCKSESFMTDVHKSGRAMEDVLISVKRKTSRVCSFFVLFFILHTCLLRHFNDISEKIL